MRISYDPNADAISITFREGKVAKTVEIAPEILIDLDEKNRPLYLEIIGAKEKLGRKNVQEILMENLLQEPASVK